LHRSLPASSVIILALLATACGGGSGGGGGGGGGGNAAPVISGTPATTIFVGDAYSFVPTVTDADGDTLTFSVTGTPSWATLNVTTGELSGTPTNLHAGRHGPITISVSDGTDSSSLATFSIDVPAPFELLSGEPGTGVIGDVELAFMGNGDGIAIWRVDTHASPIRGGTLHYSVYTAATQTWSASEEFVSVVPPKWIGYGVAGGDDSIGMYYTIETEGPRQLFGTTFANGQFAVPELLDETSNSYLQIVGVSIASSGAGYAVAWRRDETLDLATSARERIVRAAQLPAVGAAWESAETLSTQGDVGNPMLASNGSSYLLLWVDDTAASSELMVAHSVGPGWSAAPTTVGTVIATSPVVASNGSDYQLVWVGDDGGVDSVLGTNFSSSFVQSAVVPLEGSATAANDPAIVSNGSDYLVTWLQPSASLHAAIGSTASGFGAPVQIGAATDWISNTRLASNGTDYAVVWNQFEAPVNQAWANLYNGAWQMPQRLDTGAQSTSPPFVAPTATGFAAYYAQRPANNENADLFGYAFDAATWGAGAPTLLESLDGFLGLYAVVGNGTNAFAVWDQYPDDASAEQVYVVRTDAPFTAAQMLVTAPVGSAALPYRLLTNDAGMTLAVWTQQNGATRETYASVKDASGAWSAPVALGIDGLQAYSVSANDAGFAVVGNVGTSSDQDYDIVARVFDGQSWSARAALDGTMTGSTQSVALASDGTSFMAAWAQAPAYLDSSSNRRAWTSLYENGAWGAPVQIDDGADFVQALRIATNGSSYMLAWNNLESTLPINVYDGAAWSGHTLVTTDDVNGSPEVLSDGTGYLLYWLEQRAGDTETNVYASVSPTGAIGDFATMRVSDDSVRAIDATAATDGTGYALVWSVFESNRFGGPIASVWDGAAWSAPESLDSNVFNTWLSGIAANPATGAYAVAWEAWDDDAFTSSTLTANVHDGAAWLGEVAVETSDERLNAFVADGSAAYLLAASATAFGIAWVQEDGSGSGFAHAHYATFNGTGWAGTQLEGQAGAADDALIASNGDTFTVFWRQADPAGHPAVQLPFVYDGLP
jgi:hypothetical protein